MTTCEDCGGRVYDHGCVNCNEAEYIAEQERLTDLIDSPQTAFHSHLDLCSQCLHQPFNLCHIGAALLRASALGRAPIAVPTPEETP